MSCDFAALWKPGCLLCGDLEEWDGSGWEGGSPYVHGEGIHVYIELICYIVQQKVNIVKQLHSNFFVNKSQLDLEGPLGDEPACCFSTFDLP